MPGGTDTDIAENEYDTCRLGAKDSLLNTTLFTPDQPGTYILKTVIIDANGISDSICVEFEITNPPIITLTADPTTKISYVNKPINLTASVVTDTGVGDLTYRFYYKKGSTEEDIRQITDSSSRTSHRRLDTSKSNPESQLQCVVKPIS